MALVDAEYISILVSVGSNGRVSDGGVFAANGISSYVEESLSTLEKTSLPGRNLPVPNVIVADVTVPLKPYLLKPFPYNSEGYKRTFNFRLGYIY
ncbi:hypothetical protein PR048_010795 [Dryococelus australis]|uniref:Uncharacterized protein n=1 Tax=Dryococelus australis TaxID=614101 RepID=A0ABQ9I4W3_9NEOP|nr:hypothetical protein PR048_010795 [Dryococelus australis]